MSKMPIMTMEKLKQVAPSIFTMEAHHSVSDRYTYISTAKILEIMMKNGWYPVNAFENKVRNEDKQNFQKHLIVLQNFSSFLMEEDEVPQLILTSSHDKTACVELKLGVYRLICQNGLILADSIMEAHKIKHTGFREDDVTNAINSIVNYLPSLEEKIKTYKKIELELVEELAFAKAAAKIRFDTDIHEIDYKSMLEVRRSGDIGKDLWKCFNRVEEACLRGGIKLKNLATQKNFTSKEIQSIDSKLDIGQKLFGLADKVANLKLFSNQQLIAA